MINTLARIADYTDKGIYLIAENLGSICYQDLYNAGYKEAIIYKSLKRLIKAGFITKIQKGFYRPTCTGVRNHRSIVQVAEPLPDCGEPVSEYRLDKKELKNKKLNLSPDTTKPYPTAVNPYPDTGSVNVVNMLTNKLTA